MEDSYNNVLLQCMNEVISMEGSMHDASTVMNEAKVSRKRIKPKALKESALVAGLAALQELEDLDVAPRPVTITARTLVEEGIESIQRSRAKGIPLIRIYMDLKKAAGLRIGYQTFAGYVSGLAREKGLRPAKTKAEAGSSTRPRPGSEPSPVTVEASSAVEETASPTDWNCDRCETTAVRLESTKNPGKHFWKCQACSTFYVDDDGRLTNKKMGG